MSSWYNADGLNVEFGRTNTRKANRPQSVKSYGSTQELQLHFNLADLAAGTAFPVDRNNDGTNDGFHTGSIAIPDQAYIESAVIYMTDTAAAGGTSLAVGLFQENGTPIDADGLITAANGAVANLTANAKVTGTGADVGTGVTEKNFIALVVAGTFTAGVGTVVIKYTLPQSV